MAPLEIFENTVNIVPLNFPLKWPDIERRRCYGQPKEEKSCPSLYTYWEHLPEEIEA